MFVYDSKKEMIVPCPGWFGGTKDRPLDIGEGCYRQIDSVAAEFNIPVVTTLDEWVYYYNYCIRRGNEVLKSRGNKNLELIALSSHYFYPHQLTHKRHVTFGCSSSQCAYDWSILSPNPEDAGNMRTTGAHIHIGFKVEEGFGADVVKRLIMCMDKCVGIPSVKMDKDRNRRKIYGQAGEFRDKMVGDGDTFILEYRTLGGGLITPEGIPFMYIATRKALELYHSDYKFEDWELNKQREYINSKVHQYV